jgi:hypothetical protein
MADKANTQDQTPDGDFVVRTVGRDFRVAGNNVDGYIGVSAEYRTYASDTEKPFLSQEDVDLLVRSGLPTDVEKMTAENARTSPRQEPVEADKGKAKTTGSSTPAPTIDK